MSAVTPLPPGDSLPIDHPVLHEGPVSGPGVWTGVSMRGTDEWQYIVKPTEVDELLTATAASKASNPDIKSISRPDFSLPTFGPVLDALRHEIINGRGFVLMRGLPVEQLSFEDAARMYWGLGTYFGHARSQNTRGHLLGHVTDITDIFKDKSDRGYLSARHLSFHCDSVDVVGLLCLRKAKTGGLSSIASSYTIHNEMWRRRPDLARALYGPIARDRRDEIPEGKGPWYELPVFNYHQGRLAVNYLRRHIDMSQRHPSARRMSNAVVEGLDLFFALANEPDIQLRMDFEPGDLQLLHNHQILHDRTAYEDWPERERRRYLLRLWLSPPDGLELPEAFAGRYRNTTVGDRGGVDIPGLETVVPLSAL